MDVKASHTEGVNPARAGMIPPTASAVSTMSGKPRASGDDPHLEGLAPHETP